MLKSLQIENYAIIRSLRMDFEEGFTVITGETGAGKSILMGALSLLSGNRAETDVLFDKGRKCIVEGTFDISNLGLEVFFSSNDLDFHNETTIRREINESGKSRAFINDTPVNLTTLRTLSSALIDIHSQHKTLMLQDADFRLALLDQFAQNQSVLEEYKSALNLWRKKKKEYAELKTWTDEAAARHDYNNFVINELEAAELSSEEQELNERRIRELSNAEKIKSHLFNSLNMLTEQDGVNVAGLLGEIHGEIKALEPIGGEYEAFAQRVESLKAEAQDLSFDLSRKCDAVEVNPGLIESLNARMDLLYTLQNKYRVEDTAGLIELLERLRKESEAFNDNSELLEKLSSELSETETLLKKSAVKLSESRAGCRSGFVKAVKERLALLDLGGGDFEVVMKDKGTYSDNGADEVTFMFSANRGVAASDLAKTASGGELSRIMLCLKSIITDTVLLPTVVFDEIDSGISGTTATKVADVMSLLSLNHQVISITHLPQIAAKGGSHFLVYKEQDETGTATRIRRLDAGERERVLATMLSGSEASESALKTAHEMLNGKQ